jgi:hypothetical protein
VPCSADFKGTHALLGEDSAVLAVAELERRLDELGDAGDASVLLLVRAVPSLADELGLGLCEARGLTDALHTLRSPLLQTSQNLLEADLYSVGEGSLGTHSLDGGKNPGLAVVATVGANTEVDLLGVGVLREIPGPRSTTCEFVCTDL